MNWIKIEPGMELPQENVIAWYPNWGENGSWGEAAGLAWGDVNGKPEAFESGDEAESYEYDVVSHYLVIESP